MFETYFEPILKDLIKIILKTEIDNTIELSSLNQTSTTGFCTP